MDDRSLTSRSRVAGSDLPSSTLDQSLAYTVEFDLALGMTENLGKRQRWARGDGTPVEHLGLAAIPSNPNFGILPRGGWERLVPLVNRLHAVP
eukprot:2248230-Alexandrium_andersonii.AAC.1